MKIVADKDIPFLRGVLEPFGVEMVYLGGTAISRADVADARAIVTRTRTRCDAALLDGSKVEMIATATIGGDHIDAAYCRDRGIEVATSAGCNARAVLQWVSAVMRRLFVDGRMAGPGRTTIGVVGVGNVGSLVARYARSWGFETLCCDPPLQRARGGDFVSLDNIARRSDIVTFHVPLTTEGPDATAGMLSKDFLEALKPNAVVLNSSRGGVADQEALLEAVLKGRCDCAIDTWEGEPDIDRRLARAALLATPHIAGYSAEGKATATAMAVRALARHFGLNLAEWFPPEGFRSQARDITWDEMCEAMPQYFDIESLSASLKRNPEKFEDMRNDYVYRREFF